MDQVDVVYNVLHKKCFWSTLCLKWMFCAVFCAEDRCFVQCSVFKIHFSCSALRINILRGLCSVLFVKYSVWCNTLCGNLTFPPPPPISYLCSGLWWTFIMQYPKSKAFYGPSLMYMRKRFVRRCVIPQCWSFGDSQKAA